MDDPGVDDAGLVLRRSVDSGDAPSHPRWAAAALMVGVVVLLFLVSLIGALGR